MSKPPSGWQTMHLGRLVISADGGVSVNGEDRRKSSNEKGVLRVSAVSNGEFRPEEHKTILQDELALAKTSPKADRVIISRSNTEALVGASAYVEKDYPDLYLSDKLWQLEPNPQLKTSMRWLSYWLSSDEVRRRLSKLGTGTSSSMKNISKEELLSLRIVVPPYDEQEQIAALLQTWDAAVSRAAELHANSCRQKQALTQQLLTGKRRLGQFQSNPDRIATPHGTIPSDWQYPRIEAVAQEVSLKHTSGTSYPVLSCTKYEGLVDSLAYFKKQVFSENLSTYKVVPRNCFVYATNHIEEGSIGHQDLYDFGLVSPMYTVFRTDNALVDDGYLYRLLKTEHYRQIFSAATNSSVDRRGSLRWNEFKKLHVPLPSIEEQRAIANLFDLADREIEIGESKLALLSDEKRALMQQLLSGKRRVRLIQSSQEARVA